MCFFNSETGFLHISQIRFVGFGLCFDPLCFFQMTFTDETLGANVAGYILGIVNFLMMRQGAMVVERF